jgi:hypothetical protein
MSKSTVSPRDTLAPKLREKSNKLKQLDLFYKDPLEDGHGGRAEERPEDCVPDLPENQEVRIVNRVFSYFYLNQESLKGF